MVKSDGTPVLIDWGTAHFGEKNERTIICGTRRANSIQSLALDAFNDDDLPTQARGLLFGRGKPCYDIQLNDIVQMAHILSALWTSCSSKGKLICSAFGPSWDEACEKMNAGHLVVVMLDIYTVLDKCNIFEMYPEPFRSIITQMVLLKEEGRLSAIEAWRRLWYTEFMTAPSGKQYNIREFMEKPPADESPAWKSMLQEIISAHTDGVYNNPRITAPEVLVSWEAGSMPRKRDDVVTDENTPNRNSNNKNSRKQRLHCADYDMPKALAASVSSIASRSTQASLTELPAELPTPVRPRRRKILLSQEKLKRRTSIC